MLKLRRFLQGCFSTGAVIYFSASLYTIPTLFRTRLPHRSDIFDQEGPLLQTAAVLLVGLSYLIYLLPLIFALIFGMAWWQLKFGKPSARRWAIAASISLLLSSLPPALAAYSMNRYGVHGASATLWFLVIASFVLGVAGIYSFTKQDNSLPAKSLQPTRVQGDGTSKIFDAVSLLLSIFGTVALIHLYGRWGFSKGLPTPHGLASWLQWAVVILAVIVIHEAAHAIVGLALGMKLCMLAIGPFQWRVMDGCWSFKFSPNQIFAFSGAAGLVSPDPNVSLWNDFAMIAAGPFSNLVTGAIAAAFAYSAPDQPWEPFWEFFAFFATMSLMTCAVNLIPFRPEAFYSDGARIYQLFSKGPVADYQRATKTVLATAVSARRPSTYDIAAIQRASTHFTSGQNALLLRLWAMTYFIDIGRLQEASVALAEAETIYHQSASDIPVELLSIFVLNVVLLRQDKSAARDWWDRLEARKPERLNGDYWLAKCACYWAEDDLASARQAWQTGQAFLDKTPHTGTFEFDRDCYRRFNGLLEECVVAGSR